MGTERKAGAEERGGMDTVVGDEGSEEGPGRLDERAEIARTIWSGRTWEGSAGGSEAQRGRVRQVSEPGERKGGWAG